MQERRINKAAVVSLLLMGGTIVSLAISGYHLHHAEQKIRALLTEQPTLDARLTRMERLLTETPTPTLTPIPR